MTTDEDRDDALELLDILTDNWNDESLFEDRYRAWSLRSYRRERARMEKEAREINATRPSRKQPNTASCQVKKPKCVDVTQNKTQNIPARAHSEGSSLTEDLPRQSAQCEAMPSSRKRERENEDGGPSKKLKVEQTVKPIESIRQPLHKRGAKKKDANIEMVPEERQIFKGLKFCESSCLLHDWIENLTFSQCSCQIPSPQLLEKCASKKFRSTEQSGLRDGKILV